MSTVAWSAWFDEVLPDVPGCTQDVAINAIRNAAIDFCEQSRAWIYHHPDINYVSSQADYSFTPPAETKIATIDRVWDTITNRELFAKGPDELVRLFQNWSTVTGQPLYYTDVALDSNTFTIVPFPDTSTIGAMKANLSLKPTRTAAGIDQILFEEYLDTISVGAKARLMLQPAKHYSNDKLAVVYLRMFRSMCTEAYNRVQRGVARAQDVKFVVPRRGT